MKDEYIIGISKVKVDEKTRIILPLFCNFEQEDNVIIISRDKYIELWNSNTIINTLKEYRNKIKNSSDTTEINYYINESNLITAFITEDTKGIIKIKNRRLLLGKNLIEKHFINIKDFVIIEGCGDHIRVWQENEFRKYQDRLKKMLILKKKK